MYDQNVQEGFPVLSALLQKARQIRKAEKLPRDWVDAKGRCEAWLDATHRDAWKMIQVFDVEDCNEDGGENGDGEDESAVETTRLDNDNFISFHFRPAWLRYDSASGGGAARQQGGEKFEATLASCVQEVILLL